MSKTKMDSWKDCTDGRKVTNFAEEKGCKVRRASGSHIVAEYPEKHSSMTYYDGDISTGVACKIFKWFKTMGFIVIILGIPYYIINYILGNG